MGGALQKIEEFFFHKIDINEENNLHAYTLKDMVGFQKIFSFELLKDIEVMNADCNSVDSICKIDFKNWQYRVSGKPRDNKAIILQSSI